MDATVGTDTQRMPRRWPAAFTASMVEPPPMPTITSAPSSSISRASRSTSAAVA
ncbi:Uncharacterised protein [Mycobacteroides abscessus]|nr:Uncharacterised protein [Mycobacteroides abscessus]